ncbi:MAG: ABC transporter substrate-binding protein [Sphingomonas fennica]
MRRLAIPLLLAMSACGPKAAPDGRVTLVLGDQVGLSEAKVKAADAFRGARFAVRWATFAGAAPLFEALNAGAVDTAPAGDTPVIAAAAAKAPIRIVAATRASGRSVAILVPKGSPIARVSDLRGKQVIVSSARGSIAHYLLLGALREAGVPPAAVKIGFMLPGDAQAAFASGRIDAWATFGTYQALAEADGARVLRDGRGINSGLSFLTVSEAALADPAKRAAIVDYVRRQRAANAWAAAHPEPYARVFARVTRVTLPIARVVVGRERPTLIAPDAAVMRDLQRVADRFADEGVLPARVDVAPLVDATVFAEAARR